MNAIERLLNTARAEIGYLEKATNSLLNDKTANAGSNNWTKYAAELDRLGVYNTNKNGYAWCDIFVDWCFVTTFGLDIALKMINQTPGDCGAGCKFSVQYYKNAGQFYSNPQPGDQIFFINSSKQIVHTGIVEDVRDNRVYTIEGNTSDKSGVVANGGSVSRKSYPKTYALIYGYGRPNWSLVQIYEDKNDEEDENMTLDTFKKLMNEYRAELRDNDCGGWSQEARAWAISTGLFAGGNPLPDGSPNYMWADMLTREQAAQLFYNFAKKNGMV